MKNISENSRSLSQKYPQNSPKSTVRMPKEKRKHLSCRKFVCNACGNKHLKCLNLSNSTALTALVKKHVDQEFRIDCLSKYALRVRKSYITWRNPTNYQQKLWITGPSFGRGLILWQSLKKIIVIFG